MEERVIERDDMHEISLVEFIAPSGRIITSFFKVIRQPDQSLGVYDTLFDARDAVQLSLTYNFIPTIH